MTPLGVPVEPDVYIMIAVSSGVGSTVEILSPESFPKPITCWGVNQKILLVKNNH